MSGPTFSFTRVPSTKVSVSVVESGLVAANNTLVLIGRRLNNSGADGGTASANNVPYQIENFGDPVAAQTEAEGLFGVASELSQMIVAAITAIQGSDLVSPAYPPIVAIPMGHAATDSSLATTLAANVTIPMPHVAVPFAVTDTTASAALLAHLTLISASDRGTNGQFGSFGYMGSLDSTSNTTTATIALASQLILTPWLRDTGPAQAVYIVAAAFAAICAANDVPYLPLNGVKIGGLLAPAASADWHTSGDTGTEELGLAGGAVPLMIGPAGEVRISRTVTTLRTVTGVVDASYYDMQDWQVLYFYRENAYNLAQQPRYKIAHATDQKLLALKSELISLAKDFEALEMFQDVDALVAQWTVTRPPGNRFAGIYYLPVNVVPGFHNKGIGLVGTEQFDALTITG